MNHNVYSVAEAVVNQMDTQNDNDTTEQGVTGTESETLEPEGEAETEEEGATGPESEESEDPTEEEAGNEYENLSDIKEAVRLLKQKDERLASKDKGYSQMEPYIKTGKLIENVFDPENPNAEKAVEELLSQISNHLGRKVSLETPEIPIAEYDEDSQEFFKGIVAPHVDNVAKSLLRRIADLEERLGEPLKAYDSSKKETEFKTRVKQEAPQTLRIFELRTQIKATEADLEAAMRKYPHNTPLEALTLHKPARHVPKPKGEPPAKLGQGTNTHRQSHVDPYANPKLAAKSVADELWNKHMKG